MLFTPDISSVATIIRQSQTKRSKERKKKANEKNGGTWRDENSFEGTRCSRGERGDRGPTNEIENRKEEENDAVEYCGILA